MRALSLAMLAALALTPLPAQAKDCKLTPKQVATRFMDRFYIQKDVRGAFETWVDPGYIQHNPMAATGRDAAIAFLEPFFKQNPAIRYEIKRVIAEGDLVAVHAWGRFSETDRGIAVVDILRIKGCRVMEHWDVVQPVPEKSANSNGMF
jgi:predicted SnoaL-like aldol condensation-catalyzing enzyme